MAVRFIMEVAWQAHFVTNMFIRPTAEDLKDFTPDFIVYNASKAKLTNYKELGLNSETAVVFNITSREQVIINTWYGGGNEEGYVLNDELLPSPEGHRINALLCKHRPSTVRTPPSSSAFQAQARPPFQPTRSVCLSVTTSTAGTTTACSTLKAAAMQR